MDRSGNGRFDRFQMFPRRRLASPLVDNALEEPSGWDVITKRITKNPTAGLSRPSVVGTFQRGNNIDRNCYHNVSTKGTGTPLGETE